MTHRFLLLAALAAAPFAEVPAQMYHQAWWGSAGTQVSSVKINSQGHLLAVIITQDTATFLGDTLPYPAHLYLTSISPMGDVEWIQPVGAHVWSFNFERTGMVLDDDDNIYLAAPYTTDTHVGDTVLTGTGSTSTFIAKFDPTGGRVWVKHVATNLLTRCIDRAPNGELVIGGVTQGLQLLIGADTVPVLGNQSTDIVLVKLDEDGDVLWYDRSGGPGWYSDNCADVAFDALGNIIMTGWFRSDSWFDSIFITDFMTGNFNGFVAGYSAGGDAQWVTRLGYEPQGLDADDLGNTYALGYANLWYDSLLVTGVHGSRHYLARLDALGNIAWIVQPWNHSFGIANDVVTDGAGNAWVVGHHRDSLALGPFIEFAPGLNALMVYKADANGTIEWMDLQGNAGSMADFRPMAIGRNDSCGLVIGGSYGFSDPLSLGSASLPPAPAPSAFIISMDDCALATGITHSVSEDVLIYPNPTTDVVHVRSSGRFGLVEVVDIFGRRVHVISEWRDPGLLALDVRHLAAGAYVVRLQQYNATIIRVIHVE